MGKHVEMSSFLHVRTSYITLNVNARNLMGSLLLFTTNPFSVQVCYVIKF